MYWYRLQIKTGLKKVAEPPPPPLRHKQPLIVTLFWHVTGCSLTSRTKLQGQKELSQQFEVKGNRLLVIVGDSTRLHGITFQKTNNIPF
jgi:hypothetical protein